MKKSQFSLALISGWQSSTWHILKTISCVLGWLHCVLVGKPFKDRLLCLDKYFLSAHYRTKPQHCFIMQGQTHLYCDLRTGFKEKIKIPFLQFGGISLEMIFSSGTLFNNLYLYCINEYNPAASLHYILSLNIVETARLLFLRVPNLLFHLNHISNGTHPVELETPRVLLGCFPWHDCVSITMWWLMFIIFSPVVPLPNMSLEERDRNSARAYVYYTSIYYWNILCMYSGVFKSQTHNLRSLMIVLLTVI